MKTYHITYTEINHYPVEIEANSPGEAEEKLYDNFSDYVDTLRPDNTEISIEISEENESDSVFTEKELSCLSDCVLQAIANNNRAAALVFDPTVIGHIEMANHTLQKLNSKICTMLKGN